MPRSAIVLSAARRFHWLARPAVRLYFTVCPRSHQPHWLLRELKETLAVRISRTMDIDGFQIQVDPFDGPGHVFWRTGLTEPETRRVLAGIIKPGMVMLDIGAYVGQFTLVASRVAGDQLKILAIEPTP